MILLEIRPASGAPFQHSTDDDSLVIGRSTQADVTVADRSLSRQHARLFRDEKTWFVEDLGSHNGTVVNDHGAAEPTPLRSGDVLRLGSTVVIVGFEGADGVLDSPPVTRSMPVYLSAETILERSRHLEAAAATTDLHELRRLAERFKIINEVHEALSRSITVDELLELILDRVFLHLEPQYGAIYLTAGDGVICAASRTQSGAPEDVPESSSLVREVIGNAHAALVTDLQADDRFAEAPSMLAAGLRTLVAAPLMTPDGALGMIVLSSTRPDHRFTRMDLELLVPLASAAALRIRNVTLAEEAAERRRYEREVAIARRIQVALLPTELPAVEGYELFGGNTPSLGVSGDYFQIVRDPGSNECFLLLADVAGKGISASLITAYLDALCSCTIETGLSPGECFRDISRRLNRRTPIDRFATAFLGALDLPSGLVRYASAGHEPAILVRNGDEIEWLGRTGLPLGLLPDAEYETAETRLQPGDLLVLYSDGLTDASNPTEEDFGRDRLAEVCRRHHHEPPAALASAIDTALDDFVKGEPFGDDRTLVLVRRSQT